MSLQSCDGSLHGAAAARQEKNRLEFLTLPCFFSSLTEHLRVYPDPDAQICYKTNAKSVEDFVLQLKEKKMEI